MASDIFRALRRKHAILHHPPVRRDDYAMSVDKSTVVRIASLARIRVPEEDLDDLADELSAILGWVEQLNEVDTEGVTPMSSTAEATGQRLREDAVTAENNQDKVLRNAPDSRDGFFVVPKVIE